MKRSSSPCTRCRPYERIHRAMHAIGVHGSAISRVQSGRVENPSYDDCNRHECPSSCSLVEVQAELVRVRPQPHGVDFLLRLVPDPGVDHVGGEHVAAEQELVILAQRGQRLVQRARRRRNVLPAPRATGRRCPCPAARPGRSCSGCRRSRPSAWPRRPGTDCSSGRGSGTRPAWPWGSGCTSGSGNAAERFRCE